jgi:hypothetical protein
MVMLPGLVIAETWRFRTPREGKEGMVEGRGGGCEKSVSFGYGRTTRNTHTMRLCADDVRQLETERQRERQRDWSMGEN